MFKNKIEPSRNHEKHNQTGITVKIHVNHDGVRATAIMMRSIAANCKFGCRSFSKHTTSAVCFIVVMKKKICVSLLATIRSDLNAHFTLRFCYKTEKLLATILNSTCRTYYFSLWTNTDCALWWLLWLFDIHFWQLWSYSTNQIIWTILTRILKLYWFGLF